MAVISLEDRFEQVETLRPCVERFPPKSFWASGRGGGWRSVRCCGLVISDQCVSSHTILIQVSWTTVEGVIWRPLRGVLWVVRPRSRPIPVQRKVAARSPVNDVVCGGFETKLRPGDPSTGTLSRMSNDQRKTDHLSKLYDGSWVPSVSGALFGTEIRPPGTILSVALFQQVKRPVNVGGHRLPPGRLRALALGCRAQRAELCFTPPDSRRAQGVAGSRHEPRDGQVARRDPRRVPEAIRMPFLWPWKVGSK